MYLINVFIYIQKWSLKKVINFSSSINLKLSNIHLKKKSILY